MIDDKKSFDCKVSQTGRKAITSTNSNAELGLYFRKRLGLESGAFVTKDDLLKYGRTDFILKKLDPETFYLDFRKPNWSFYKFSMSQFSVQTHSTVTECY